MSKENQSIPVTQDNNRAMMQGDSHNRNTVTEANSSDRNDDDQSTQPNKKRSRTSSVLRNRAKNVTEVVKENNVLLDILDSVNAKSKTGEKHSSARSHFEYYLALRNTKLIAEGKESGISSYDELTFDLVDKGPYIGEFANYIARVARMYMNPKKDLLSYLSATGYLGAVKNDLLDKFHRIGVPSQLKEEVWKRKITRVWSIKVE